MKRCLAAWCVIAAFAALAARADSVLPAAYPADRYARMSGHSPFAPPTIAAPVAPPVLAPTGSWADKFSVTLLMQQGGTYFATVLDKDSSQHFIVSSDKENERNMMLASVQWNDHFNQTRITIRRGTEFGQIAFDPSTSATGSSMGSQTPAGPASLFRPPIPGAQPFHPPPGANGGLAGRPSSSIVRRGPIAAGPPNSNALRAVPAEPLAKSLSNDPDNDDDDDN